MRMQPTDGLRLVGGGDDTRTLLVSLDDARRR